ncbi:unnamed protein product, partial [Heterosigma akashiwo]
QRRLNRLYWGDDHGNNMHAASGTPVLRGMGFSDPSKMSMIPQIQLSSRSSSNKYNVMPNMIIAERFKN